MPGWLARLPLFGGLFARRAARALAARHGPWHASWAWDQRLQERIDAEDWEGFERAAAELRAELAPLAGLDAGTRRVTLAMCTLKAELARGRVEPMLAAVADVRAAVPLVGADDARHALLDALCMATVALDPEAPDERLVALATEALAASADVPWSDTRDRLAGAAVQLARVQRAQGDPEGADATAARALELAAPPAGPDAKLFASQAAREAAERWLPADETGAGAAWLQKAADAVASDDSPACRQRHALMLFLQNNRVPGDLLFDASVRAARNQLVLERLADLADADARRLRGRAQANLGQIAGLEGRHAEAVAHFVAGLREVDGLDDPMSLHLAVELRIVCGRARVAAQDPVALQDFRAGFDAAAAAADPDTRALALSAAFALHPKLVALGMPAAGADLLERAQAVAESLPGAAGRRAVAQVGLERSRALHAEGRSAEAREVLRLALAGLDGEDEAEVQPVRRLLVCSLGYAAFAAAEYDEAVDWYERSLVMPWPDEPEQDAERAELEWHYATALVRLDRLPEARGLYARAFERGRASGVAGGRYAAAQSALQLAEHTDLAAERRRWLGAAASLAQLVGNAEGDRLAQHAQTLLRETPGGA